MEDRCVNQLLVILTFLILYIFLFADLCSIVSVYMFLCNYFILLVLISVTTFRIVTFVKTEHCALVGHDII